MTRADIFIQILSEVSGKPKEEISTLLEVFNAAFPGPNKFDEELTDDAAQKLLEGLRKEKDGIRQWLMEGYLQFVLASKPPAGHA